jgi:hypothetical protein
MLATVMAIFRELCALFQLLQPPQWRFSQCGTSGFILQLGAKKPAMFTGAYAVLLVFVFLVFQLLLKVPLDSTRLWGG